METLAGIANTLNQVCLHEGMDILVLFGKYQLAGLDICQDTV